MHGFSRWLPALLAACLTLLVAAPALAHERREVGQYMLVVGFNTEPAFEGQVNGAQLRVLAPNGAERQGVAGLEDTLQVEVSYAGRSRTMALRPVFGQPGLYVADFMPTAPGRYTFRFFGTIEGTAVDETFVSGPGRFNDVQPIAEVQFPEEVPAAPALARQVDDAAAQASQAQSRADQGRLLGILGVALGAGGLVLGGLGYARASRKR